MKNVRTSYHSQLRCQSSFVDHDANSNAMLLAYKKTPNKHLVNVCTKTRPSKVHNKVIDVSSEEMMITHCLVLHHMIWQMTRLALNFTLLNILISWLAYTTLCLKKTGHL